MITQRDNLEAKAALSRHHLDEDTVFGYLLNLRDSGYTNMFGAGRYLIDTFDFTRNEAHAVLAYWMESFREV